MRKEKLNLVKDEGTFAELEFEQNSQNETYSSIALFIIAPILIALSLWALGVFS